MNQNTTPPTPMVLPPYNVLMMAFGELSVQFSNLEYQVSELFAVLADPSPSSFGGALLADEFPLNRHIRLIRHLANFRFAGDDQMTQRVLKLCKRVDTLRVSRNAFVHGLWCFDPEKVNQGTITVLDMRWQQHKAEVHWSRGESKDYTIQNLLELRKEAWDLFCEIAKVCEIARKAKLQPIDEPEDETHKGLPAIKPTPCQESL